MTSKKQAKQLSRGLFDYNLALKNAGNDKNSPNIAAISRIMGVEYTNTYFWVKGAARWPAEAWIKACMAAGFGNYRKGYLIISLAVPKELQEAVEAQLPKSNTAIYKRKRGSGER